jgi:hypothetical protein
VQGLEFFGHSLVNVYQDAFVVNSAWKYRTIALFEVVTMTSPALHLRNFRPCRRSARTIARRTSRRAGAASPGIQPADLIRLRDRDQRCSRPARI